MPQPGPWQQSGFNDAHLLQQHIMLKQMQELQRQQQLHQLGDVRQQNSLSQLSATTKQAAGGHFPNLINGEPLHDASHMYMNWGQHGASPALQGVPKRQLFSHEQGRTLVSMGQVPQQLDASLYGTPVANARSNLNRYPHLQGITNDHGSSLIKAVGNQAPKPAMHSSAINTSFLGEQGFSRQNLFEQTPHQGLNSGNLLENCQQVNTHHKNLSLQESNGRQERSGWSGSLQDTAKQISPSQSSVTLDPLEEKILFGTNDNTWDPSFDGRTELGIGSFGNALEQTDCLGAFPSIQSGSWSALMQSAVAEASSSDTGLQEEWSGLTFQNMELSVDNQPSNFVDSGKQHAGCNDSNMQSASSLSSKPFAMVNDSNFFPGFQHSSFQFSSERKEGVLQDSSHVSSQQALKNTGNYLPCNTQQTLFVEGSKHVQPLGHSGNAWSSQAFKHSDSDVHHQSVTGLAKSKITEAEKEASRQVPDDYHLDYMRRADITTRQIQNESMANDHRELSNGPQSMDKSDHGGREAYGKQQNCFQRENSIDRYNSVALQHANTGRDARENVPSSARDCPPLAPSHQESANQGSQVLPNYRQGFFGQSNIIDSFSNNAVNLEKRHLPDIQGNSKASEEVLSRGNRGSNISASFDRTIGFYVPNDTAQTRENMPELYQKVDHLRKDSSVTHLGTVECHPVSQSSKAETPDASAGQLYNQSSVSQGFGLRLAPPFERVANPNLLLSSQSSPQTGRHVNQELGEKGRVWLTPPCAQSLSPSHRSSQREHWDDKCSSSGQMDIKTSHLNMQGTYPASLSQIQRQHMPNAPVEFQSFQALSGPAIRLPPFNLAPSQDTLRPINVNSSGQEFPVSEAVPFTQPSIMSGMSQQGEVSVKPHNVWTNIPIRRLSPNDESHKVFSTDSPNNSLETTSLASQDPNDQISQHDGIKLSEFGACSADQQGIDYEEEQQRKTSQHQVSSNILDPASQTGNLWHQYVAKQLQDARAVASGSLVAPLHPQDSTRVWQGDNQAPAASLKIREAFSHSLQQSDVFHQNHSLLQQVQAMRNVETDQGAPAQYNGVNSNLDVQQVTAMTGQQSFYGNTTRVRNPMGNELNTISQFRAGNDVSFLSGARENNTMKAFSPQLANISTQEGVKSDRNDTQSQYSNSNVVSKRTEHQNSLQMANSWFQHYGNFKNGQMLPQSDPRTAKAAQSLHIHSSSDQVDSAIASQIGSVWPSSAATLVVNEPLSTPYVISSDTADQSLAVRPKKRKTATSELLPWHKEVTQSSQRLQNISMVEIEWAQAANRLTEKVEDKSALMEDGNPLLRPKKRLILTTQLMQQLLHPPPAAIFSVNATSGFDSVAYFVAKFSLRDACGLASFQRSDYRPPQHKSNMISDKLTTSERVGDQYFSKVMEDFINRTKKLENDFLRLDKKASIVDLLVESQELEKISIINRFAKFHIRGQADAAENSSCSATAPTASKLFLQRYVTALPMPGRLPEGLHYISL